MSWTRTKLGSNPTLRINLGKIFEVSSMPDSIQLKSAIGQEIIDIIRNRTYKQGIDWQGEPLESPYSKAYSKSLPFKAFGKSRNDVNLKLTGDMLGLMDILDIGKNTISIGWDTENEALKASGHITGANYLPKRDFFGLSEQEIDRIREKFKKEVKDLKEAKESGDIRAQADISFSIGAELIKKAFNSGIDRTDTSVSISLGELANIFGKRNE